MIIERSMHPEWRSNAYLVADSPGGHGVFIDAGAPVEQLMSRAADLDLQITHVLLTHDHHDHTTHAVELEERFGATLVLPEQAVGGMTISSGTLVLRALPTPGHCETHVAWAVGGGDATETVFTGDTLFRETIGGTLGGGPNGLALLQASILDVLLTLPASTRLCPGHMDETTVVHEIAANPFVRAWRGELELTHVPVQVAGSDATLLLEAADYDGTTKAWVRLDDGIEAIVGGSMITRAGAHR